MSRKHMWFYSKDISWWGFFVWVQFAQDIHCVSWYFLNIGHDYFKRCCKLCSAWNIKPIIIWLLPLRIWLCLVHRYNNWVIQFCHQKIDIPTDLPITRDIININCIWTNISNNFELRYHTGIKPLLLVTKIVISSRYWCVLLVY